MSFVLVHKKCLFHLNQKKTLIFPYALTFSQSKEKISNAKVYTCFSLGNGAACTEGKRIRDFVCDVTMQPHTRTLLKLPRNASAALHVFHESELETENIIVLQT